MYESQKVIFEENFLRAELTPVPRNWWVESNRDKVFVPIGGKCCALSPSVIGLSAECTTATIQLTLTFGVSGRWVDGAIHGFDDIFIGPTLLLAGPEFFDGYAWGQYMRKYLPPAE